MAGVLKLLSIFTRREKLQIIFLFSLMFIGTFAEALSIGVILPFMSVIVDPTLIVKNHLLNSIYTYIGFSNYQNFMFFFCLVIFLIFLFKNLYLFFVAYAQSRFVYNKQIWLSLRLFRSYLGKPYEWFFHRNAAELLRNLNNNVANLISCVLLQVFQVVSESLVAIALIVGLILANPLSALIAILVIGGAGGGAYLFFRRVIRVSGQKMQNNLAEMIKWVTQGLAAVKEIRILAREDYFIEEYRMHGFEYAKHARFASILNQFPRFFIELLTVLALILVVIVNIVIVKDVRSLLPTLALFAMVAFRLMPSANRILSGANTIRFFIPNLDVIYDDLLEVKRGVCLERLMNSTNNGSGMHSDVSAAISFTDKIEIQNLWYAYPQSNGNVLENLWLTFNKGDSIAITGPSGSGKTTLADILLGLLPPQQGQILVDGVPIEDKLVAWSRHVGYVPQSIYLIDDTIRNNVALGIPVQEIDEATLQRAVEMAQIDDFIKSLPDGFDSMVGERGIRLSGGQRQRIGIARALYNNPEVLILDEATSSLDEATEKSLTGAIDSLIGRKTLIIIAHRMSTIRKCNKVYRLENGVLIADDSSNA